MIVFRMDRHAELHNPSSKNGGSAAWRRVREILCDMKNQRVAAELQRISLQQRRHGAPSSLVLTSPAVADPIPPPFAIERAFRRRESPQRHLKHDSSNLPIATS